VPKLFIKFKVILLYAGGNFEDQNKVFKSSIIIINCCISIINACYNYIMNAYYPYVSYKGLKECDKE
jgi:hypothetical protein